MNDIADIIEHEIVLHGIGGSPGICIGKAYLVDREGVNVVKRYYLQSTQVTAETNRFKAAVKNCMDELQAIIDAAPQDALQQTAILESHLVLLKDKMLYGRTLDSIKNDRINAEWALKKVVSKVKTMFQNMADDYLKERATDIGHVSERVLRNLVGGESVDIASINKRVILVARDLSPGETSQIQLERVKGFITDKGGKASHTGIIARSLAIPAVLGLEKATHVIENDDLLVVDGSAGIVILNPTDRALVAYEERRIKYEQNLAVMIRTGRAAAKTRDGFHMKVLGNIELPEEVVSVRDHGGEGIGLYRTEFQYLGRPTFPTEDELFDRYRDVVEVVAPHAITIRTLDINGDKAMAFSSESDEANPALGLRAIRYCLKKPDIFKTQLRAILRAAAFGAVRVLFPMISGLEEVLEAKRLLEEAAQSLEQEKRTYNRDIPIGIMIEVPSAVFIADLLAAEVDFFSVGTNDLIQYALAIDRGNRHVAHLYHALHPAVLRMIKQVADVSREKGIELYMCGEMAGDPINVPVLLGLGMDELSMNPQSIPAVKSMIRQLDVSECEAFTCQLMQLRTVTDVNNRVQESYGKLLAEKVYSVR